MEIDRKRFPSVSLAAWQAKVRKHMAPSHIRICINLFFILIFIPGCGRKTLLNNFGNSSPPAQPLATNTNIVANTNQCPQQAQKVQTFLQPKVETIALTAEVESAGQKPITQRILVAAKPNLLAIQRK